MDAEQMMRMESLDVLKMLRAQVDIAIMMIEGGRLVKCDDKPLDPTIMLIGDFKIEPRFPEHVTCDSELIGR